MPAHEWRLSDAGRLRCKALAAKLSAHSPNIVVSSIEPKAVETSQITANLLGRPFEIAQGLHEHDRGNVGFLGEKQFEAAIAQFFEKTRQLVLGRETADQAHQRFATAIEQAIGEYPGSNLAVVAHGTVITLFTARATGMEPYPLWKQLGLPSFVVMSLPELDLLEVAGHVEENE